MRILSPAKPGKERGKGSQLQENAKRAVINSFTVPFLLVPLSSGESEILNLCRVIESCFYDRKGKGRSGREGAIPARGRCVIQL